MFKILILMVVLGYSTLSLGRKPDQKEEMGEYEESTIPAVTDNTKKIIDEDEDEKKGTHIGRRKHHDSWGETVRKNKQRNAKLLDRLENLDESNPPQKN